MASNNHTELFSNVNYYFFQFSLQDNVQDLRQVVLDRPESCYRTCFSLMLDGVRLDDFADLHMVEGLKDNSLIKVVEGRLYYFVYIVEFLVWINHKI